MPSTTLDVSSVLAAVGWTDATVANLSTSNDVRATDGRPGEFIEVELTDTPADFGQTIAASTSRVKVEGRVVGTVSRAKSASFTVLDSGGGELFSGVLQSNFAAADQVHLSQFNIPAGLTKAQLDGATLRVTVTEGSGMGDTATVEIDRIWLDVDYDVAATQIEMSGSVSGLGDIAAVIERVGVLAGVAVGQGVMEASLTQRISLAGAVSALATLTGSLGNISVISGSVNGSGLASGILVARIPLGGNAASTASLLAALAQRLSLAGMADGSAVAFGDIGKEGGGEVDIIGAASGLATVSGLLLALRDLAGDAEGTSQAAADVLRLGGLIGLSHGQALVAADLENIASIVIVIPPCDTDVLLQPSLRDILLSSSQRDCLLDPSVTDVILIC